MKKFNSIFFDIDGTLLISGSTRVDSAVEDFLNKISESYILGVCTARSYTQVSQIIPNLHIFNYSVFCNGAQIIDCSKSKIIEEFEIDYHELKTINYIAKNNNKQLFVVREGLFMQYKSQIEKSHMALITGLSIQKWDCICKKISVELPNLTVSKGISIEKDGLDIIISHNLASKSNAILRIANYKQEDPCTYIGIGDGYTDIDFINLCGLRIAMENGVSELKSKSDVILPDVKNQGILSLSNYLN